MFLIICFSSMGKDKSIGSDSKRLSVTGIKWLAKALASLNGGSILFKDIKYNVAATELLSSCSCFCFLRCGCRCLCCLGAGA